MAKVDVGEDFFKLLHPKVTTLIVAVDEQGKPNVMACSWAMPVSEEPPQVAISLWRESYTNELIKKTKEFTVNIPPAKLLKQVWIAGTKSGKKVDKIKLAGFAPQPSRKVKPPVIAECIAHMECKLSQAVEAGECTLFIGEVVEVYADEELFKKGMWSLEKAELLLHAGGKLFITPSGRQLKP
ncbi:MAG: flavin reductase family protein [Candidatus Verstraetearchaeota archaeon]|nr:flavin reductase family protein [Candidatus Verstraetearchaeota archaeon]